RGVVREIELRLRAARDRDVGGIAGIGGRRGVHGRRRLGRGAFATAATATAAAATPATALLAARVLTAARIGVGAVHLAGFDGALRHGRCGLGRGRGRGRGLRGRRRGHRRGRSHGGRGGRGHGRARLGRVAGRRGLGGLAALAALSTALLVALALVAGRLLARRLLRLRAAALCILLALRGRLVGALALALPRLALGLVPATATAAAAAIATAATAVAAAVALAALAAALAAALLAVAAPGGRGRFGRRRADEQRLEPADDAAGGRGHHRGGRGRGGGGSRLGRGLRARLAHRRRARRLHLGDRRRRHVEVGLGERDRGHLARSAAAIARLCGFLVQLVGAQAGDLVVRGLQLLVGHDHDRRIVAGLDLGQRAALLVEQVVRDLHRRLDQHLPGVVLHGMLLGQADDRQRQRLDAAHAAVALAARADHLAGFAQARAQALAAHLEQAEARDAAQLHARAVVLERGLQAVLDLALVLVRRHVDEVDHHQAAQVAQAQLARHLLGGLQVGVERGLLDVAALGGARRVDVDRGQGLGLVDHQGAAGGQ